MYTFVVLIKYFINWHILLKRTLSSISSYAHLNADSPSRNGPLFITRDWEIRIIQYYDKLLRFSSDPFGVANCTTCDIFLVDEKNA